MSTRVKVSGVTSLQDARVCAAVGVDYIGLDQDPASARYLAPAAAREIVDWVVGPEPVGMFAGSTASEVIEACGAGGFRMAQLSQASPEECAAVEAAGVPVIRAFAILHDASAEQLRAMAAPFEGGATHVLFDTTGTSLWGGPGESLGWRAISEVASAYHLFLAGAITEANWPETSRMRPFAIDVGASVEEAPGILDFDRLGALLAAMRG